MGLSDVPTWIDREAWDGFVDMRQVMHKESRGRIPWTQRAQTIALRDLSRWHEEGYDCNHILDEAVLKGWRGLFINERTPKLRDTGPIQQSAEITRVRVFLAIVQQRDEARFRKDKLWELGCSSALREWHSLEKAS